MGRLPHSTLLLAPYCNMCNIALHTSVAITSLLPLRTSVTITNLCYNCIPLLLICVMSRINRYLPKTECLSDNFIRFENENKYILESKLFQFWEHKILHRCIIIQFNCKVPFLRQIIK